jgi:hypothetical protein
MINEPLFTRREGDQLSRRVEAIDEHGTRGMQLLSRQTAENTAAIKALRTELGKRFDQHTRQHERELHGRAAKRRARTGTAIAVWAAAVASIGLLLDIALQLPHLHR